MIKIYKVKKGKVKKFQEWGQSLQTTYRKSALETLQEEGLTFEGFFIMQIKEEWYAIAVTDTEGKPADMAHPLNIKHQEIKRDCLETLDGIQSHVVYTFLNLSQKNHK